MTKLFKPTPPSGWCPRNCILDAGHQGECSPIDRRKGPRKGRQFRTKKEMKGD